MPGTIDSNKYKYKNEAFDKLLTLMLSEMTEEQKSRLPIDLVRKIYRSKDPNVNVLTDAQKDFVLTVGFERKILKILVCTNTGIKIEQYKALADTWNKRRRSDINAEALAENMVVEGEFVLAGQDLYDAFSYKALVCHHPIFTMVLNARKSAAKYKARNREMGIWMDNLTRMFAHYESNKKRLLMEMGLKDLSEWYCLIHFYGGEQKSSTVYKEKFKYSFSCSVHRLRMGMARLKREGYLDSRGASRNNVSSISIKGRDLVDRMLTKYILNY